MIADFSFSKNTVGFIIEGPVNEITIDRLNFLILEKLKSFKKIHLYLEDNNIEEFSFGAITKELSFKLKHSNRFSKIALVSDRKWVHMCASLENILLAGEVQAFAIEDRMVAMDWLLKK